MTAELWPENDPTVHPFGDVLCPSPNPNYDGPHIPSQLYRRGASLTWFRVCCCGAEAAESHAAVPSLAVEGLAAVPATELTDKGSAKRSAAPERDR